MNIPLAAEPVFSLAGIHITNTLVMAVVVLGLFTAFAAKVRLGLQKVPGRFQVGVEMLFEALLGFFDRVTNSRAASRRFLPLVGTLFLFILVSNWLGLFPGMGTIGIWAMHEGHLELIPIFRAPTSDLNTTVALALTSVLASHVFGMVTLGFFVHWNKFIQLGTIWKALKTFNPIKILTALVEFMVGIIEIFSEIAKVLSLALRLFGNVFAGEVLLTVISGLVAFLVPLPFMGLELLVGLVQATVFSLLVLVYLTVATQAPHGSGDEHEHAPAHAH